MGHREFVPLSEGGKKQWWPSNRGICLATGAGGGACWNRVEWLTERPTEKETFLDLVKLGSQAKKRKQIHRHQERSVGGRARIEADFLETLETQTGKSRVPFPKCAEARRSPPHRHPSELMPHMDTFLGEDSTFPALQFARVQLDTLSHVLSSLEFVQVRRPQPPGRYKDLYSLKNQSGGRISNFPTQSVWGKEPLRTQTVLA